MNRTEKDEKERCAGSVKKFYQSDDTYPMYWRGMFYLDFSAFVQMVTFR